MTYPAKFTFPGTEIEDLEFTSLCGAVLSNQAIPGTTSPLIALLGRDILAGFVLIYNGTAGSFTLAY